MANYDLSGSDGLSIKFYLVNNTGASIQSGRRIDIAAKLGSYDLPNESLVVTMRGYVDLSTGVLDTVDMTLVDTPIKYNPALKNLFLQKDLPNNKALLLEIAPAIDFYNLGFKNLPVSAGYISVYAYFSTVAGVYSDLNASQGEQIFAEYDKRLIVPDGPGITLKALNGSGIVKDYSFRNTGEQSFSGLSLNTNNQTVYISRNGVCVVGVSTPSTYGIRAKVSTLNGYTKPCSWTSYNALTLNHNLIVNCVFPVNTNGYSQIRSDYTDSLIAGLNDRAKLNATKIAIYVQEQSSGTIRRFIADINPLLQQQAVTITNWSSGTDIGTSLPTIANNFGLFAPSSCSLTTSSGTSGLPAATYRVSYAFFYTTDNEGVTSISHSVTDGCYRDWETDRKSTRLNSSH